MKYVDYVWKNSNSYERIKDGLKSNRTDEKIEEMTRSFMKI